MSIQTVTITQGTALQILTGPYHIVRVTATGDAGAVANLYDSLNTKTQLNPAQTFKNLTNSMSPVRSRVDIADCAGIKRTYDYPGAGYSATDTAVGGATPMAIPVAATAVNNAGPMDVDVVSTRGIFAEVIGTAGNKVNLTIEYFPNIAAPMP